MPENNGSLGTGGKITIAVIIALIFILPTIAVLLPAKKLDIKGEEARCKTMIEEAFLKKGVNGTCRYYIGDDGQLHYKFVEYVEGEDDIVEKDVYMIWETGEEGKY